MTTISQKAADALRGSTRLRNLAAAAADCHAGTLDRWLKEEPINDNLTKAAVLNVIHEETGIPMDELLEKTPVEK